MIPWWGYVLVAAAAMVGAMAGYGLVIWIFGWKDVP